jgi:DNA-binding beta-propeller fold protein YncE
VYTYAITLGGTPPPLQDTAVFNQTRGISFDASDDVVVDDTVNQRIITFNQAGQIIQHCGMRGDGSGEFNWPRGVAVDPATGNLWVANTRQSNLLVINPSTCAAVGTPVGKLGANLGQLNWPHSIAIRGSDGTAWVADTLNNRVESWSVATHQAIAVFNGVGNGNTQPFHSPRGIALDPVSGHIWVADFLDNRIVELSDSSGSGIKFVRAISTVCASPGPPCHLKNPSGVAVDSLGNIYVADTANSQVAVLDSTGTAIGDITSGGIPSTPLNQPENVAVDQSTGKLYIADTYNDRVLQFSAGG